MGLTPPEQAYRCLGFATGKSTRVEFCRFAFRMGGVLKKGCGCYPTVGHDVADIILVSQRLPNDRGRRGGSRAAIWSLFGLGGVKSDPTKLYSSFRSCLSVPSFSLGGFFFLRRIKKERRPSWIQSTRRTLRLPGREDVSKTETKTKAKRQNTRETNKTQRKHLKQRAHTPPSPSEPRSLTEPGAPTLGGGELCLNKSSRGGLTLSGS